MISPCIKCWNTEENFRVSPFDSKLWIAENGVDTLAYGHRDMHPAVAADTNPCIDELLI